MGFGFIDRESADSDISILNDCIVSYSDNKEVRRIIVAHMNKVDCRVIRY
jgi:hypothetical protein